MIRNLRQRVLITLAATTIAALLGMLAGYLLGCAVAVRMAEGKLRQSVTSIIADAENSSLESRQVLKTMNASSSGFCSDEEIAYFRNLIFQSEYLKEAGRIRNGKIECATTLGRLPQPIMQAEPTLAQTDGTQVYRGFYPYRVKDLILVSLQMGDSFVIFSPFLETHRVQPPIHYLMSVANSSNQEARSLLGNSGLEHTSVLNRDGDGRMGDKLYATHCSTRYFNCATDYIYIPDALQIGHNEITGCVALCGIVGGCFGFIFSLIYKRNRSIEQQLRRAIQHDEIKIVYQPIVNLVGGLVVGAEALARWTDEEGFVISPDVFIKIAEERGFVSDITKLVVRHAVRDLGETLRTHPDFRLNINVAAADLVDPTFLPMLKATLKSANVPAESVAIEITEGSTAKHETAAETIRQLREMGHSVHIDDFGTGYSSLSYLHALSIDAIKIDRAFTQAIGTEAVTVSILPQILAMAKTLNLQVIVEGVETIQQASYFANSNATILAQGWLFGRPVAAEEFCKLLLEGEQKLLSADHAA